MHPVRLAGPQLVLREFCPADLDAISAVVGDDRVTHWLSYDTRDRGQASAMLAGAVERAQQTPRWEYYLAIADPKSDDLIGFSRLALGGVQAGKLGYAIRPDRWGKGLATEAACTLVGFGFRDLGLHRISAAIGPDNAASIAVVKKLGFVQEGRLRDHVFTNGEWRDSVLYSMLAHEWDARFAADDSLRPAS